MYFFVDPLNVCERIPLYNKVRFAVMQYKNIIRRRERKEAEEVPLLKLTCEIRNPIRYTTTTVACL